MDVTVVGSGYVGLVTGVGLASQGHSITCIDIDPSKVDKINKGVPPFHEEGLPELLAKVIKSKNFSATASYSSVKASDVVLICVGTPSNKDGAIDLSYVKTCAQAIGRELKAAKKFVTVVVKSTVVPGSTSSLIPILEKESGKKAGVDFGVGMVPEFLREGVAIDDFYKPDRIVLGALEPKSLSALRQLHSSFKCTFFETTIETAEMVKYASNAFLATKIGFINELSATCESVGINIDDVAFGMGLDKRVSPHFLKAGPGWGGSCFGKDVRALVAAERQMGIKPRILDAVLEANDWQKKRVVEVASKAVKGGLKGKKVALLGLAFKAGTDDIRESSAIDIVRELSALGALITAYDPQAIDNFKKIYPNIKYADSTEAAIKGADLALIVTEWPEFKLPLETYGQLLKSPAIVVDARRILDANAASKAGVNYVAIGRASKK